MNKYLKITGIVLGSFLVLMSLLFWLVLPHVINLNNYKNLVADLVQEQTKLNLDFENAQLITTPLFGIGVKIDGLKVNFADDTELFSTESIKTRVALPSLLFLTVKVSNCEINSPKVNLDVVNSKNLKILYLVENIINNQEKVLETGELPDSNSFFNPAWIKIKIPAININNYQVKINDVKDKHFLAVKGEKLVLSYNGHNFKVKTHADVYSDKDKNITANVDINSFIPEPTSFDKEDDEQIRVEFPALNPVKLYRDYNLKADLNTKLKIRAKKDGTVVSWGFLNAENITVDLAKLRLPASYFRLKTRGTRAFLDTNIFVTQNSKLNVNGLVNYSKRPSVDLALQTDKIMFNDIVLLCKSALDNISVKNDLKYLKGTGYFYADARIKTNFKKLKSSGQILVKDGGIINSVNKLGISNWNTDIDFSENRMLIKDSSLNINNSKAELVGQIDEKSITDICLNLSNLQLPGLYKAFAPIDITRLYDLQKGIFNLNLAIKGHLKKAVSSLDLEVKDILLIDKKSQMSISNKSLKSELATNLKKFNGKIYNEDFRVYIPATKSLISSPELAVNIDENDIYMTDMPLNINKVSQIKTNASIMNFMKNPKFDIFSEGALNVDDLKQILGKEVAVFLNGEGVLPFTASSYGDKKKQTFNFNLDTDKNNYITPVDVETIVNKETIIKSTVIFKEGRLKIKDTGMFVKPTQAELEANPDKKLPLTEVVTIDGTVAGNHINLIKVRMPKDIRGSICAFKDSVFEAGGRLLVFGDLDAPRVRGYFSVFNLSIPELFMRAKSLKFNFRGHHLDFITEDFVANDSDMKINSNISLVPASVININNLEFSSDNLNLDKLMKVSDNLMKKLPASNNNSVSTSSQAEVELPIAIKNGLIAIKSLTTGNIVARQIHSNLAMDKNVVYLNGLRTHVFNGLVRGDISANVITMGLRIKLRGYALDVNQALTDAIGLKDTLNGIARFVTDISLKGVTYEEQMASLNGKVDFVIREGQFGPFAKLENFILAENIRESQFFQTALGGVINSLATVDTTHFDRLTGDIELNNGVADIKTIASKGSTLCLNVFGNMDILKNMADMKVRARLASKVSDMLGPIAAVNPVNLIKKTPGLNIAAAKAFTLFTETVTQEEVDAIPMFEGDATDENATKFQIVLKGDVNKPLTLVKSFKWLALQSDIDNAKSYVDELPTPKKPEQVTK